MFCNADQNFYQYTRCDPLASTCNFCVGSEYSQNTTVQLLCPGDPLRQSTAMGLSFLGSNYLYYGHYVIGSFFFISFILWILLTILAFTVPKAQMNDCSRTCSIVWVILLIQVWFWWFVAACSMTGDNYVLPNHNEYEMYCPFRCDHKIDVFKVSSRYPSI